VTHAVAEAVAALHVAGIVHGNVHPGTILIADDGRVVLLDAHADAPGNPELDVRALGAVLYACLTGHWPWAEAGRSTLPDAPRDPQGQPVRPRQVRGGVPRHLDEIAAELLDPQVAPPGAGPLAAEFARLVAAGDEEYDYAGEQYEEPRASGPMGFQAERGGGRRLGGTKLIAGIALLAVIAVIGVIVVMKILPSSPDAGPTSPVGPTSGATATPEATPIALTGDQVRVVDPPNGQRTFPQGIENVVDGDLTTGWRTDRFTTPDFGKIKPGMGILINLGSPQKVTLVQVTTGQPGATIALRAGTSDPGDTTPGDDEIARTYSPLGPAHEDAGTTTLFAIPEASQTVQYLMVWITNLPPDTPEGYRLTVNEVEVLTVP
jgi:hypothetical protein